MDDHAAIIELLSRASQGASQHIIRSPTIASRSKATKASIRAHVRAERWIDQTLAGDGPTCWPVVGFYDDEAILTPNGWRLSSVRLTETYQSGTEAMQLAMVEGQRVLSTTTHAAGN